MLLNPAETSNSSILKYQETCQHKITIHNGCYCVLCCCVNRRHQISLHVITPILLLNLQAK